MRVICALILILVSQVGTANVSAQLPPQIAINVWYCVDSDRVGQIDVSAAPVSDLWDAAPSMTSIGQALPGATRPESSTPVDLLACRFPVWSDSGITFHLVNLISAERQTVAPTDDNWGPTFLEPAPGVYRLEMDVSGTTIITGEFAYDAGVAPALNVTVISYLSEMDWAPPTTDPENIGEVSIIPYICDGGEVRYRQSTYGVDLVVGSDSAAPNHQLMAAQTPPAVADQMRSCSRADADAYQFALMPAGSDESVPLYWTPDGRIVTDYVPKGDYELMELITGTSAGTIFVVAGQDIVFEAPAP